MYRLESNRTISKSVRSAGRVVGKQPPLSARGRALLTAATAQCERKYPGRSSLQNLLFFVYNFDENHYSSVGRTFAVRRYISSVLLSKCIVGSYPFQQYLTCSLSTKYHEPCGISPNLWNLNCTLTARGVRLSRTPQGNRRPITTEIMLQRKPPCITLHLNLVLRHSSTKRQHTSKYVSYT